MEFTVNTRIRITKGVVLIKRSLHGSNPKIFANTGDAVKPEDILGEAESSGGFTTVNLAGQLNVSPKIASEFLKRKISQTIYKGELLAQKDGFWGFKKTILLAPADGILDFYDKVTGILKIKLIPHKEKLLSGVFGIIDRIDPVAREIVVKTLAYEIYGVAGSGMERSGMLKTLGPKNLLVSSKQVNDYLEGSIVIGGAIVFTDALQKAVHTHIAGIVSGGINLSDLKAMRGGSLNFTKEIFSDVGLSVMVTEGFGAISIGDDIFEILKTHTGRFVILNGNLAKLVLPTGDSNSIIKIRSYQPMIPRPHPQNHTTLLQKGQTVRVNSSFEMGAVGVLDSIDRSPTKLPSSAIVTLSTIITKSGKIRVPANNLEVLDYNGFF